MHPHLPCSAASTCGAEDAIKQVKNIAASRFIGCLLIAPVLYYVTVKRKEISKFWVPIFLGVMALIFGSVSFLTYNSSHRLVTTGATASGTVTDLIYLRGTGRSSSGVYYPIVKFQTPEGKTIEDRATFGSSPAPYKAGDTVRVYFDPRKPAETWVIDNWFDLYFLPALFGFFATMLVIATGVVTYYMTNPRPRKR
jgi:hypothetical protein